MSVDGDKGPSSAGALLITLYSSTDPRVSQYKQELPTPALTVTAAGEFVEDAPLELSTIIWEVSQCPLKAPKLTMGFANQTAH